MGNEMTYTIMAFDPQTKDIGIAVASKTIAVGSRVPHIAPGIGAIATQANTNYMFGPKGLELLFRGLKPWEAVNKLLENDPVKDTRQVGIINMNGEMAAFTGKLCIEWKGHVVGKSVIVMGNILKGEEVLTSMLEAYEKEDGELVDKLLAALLAGDKAGGDRRGKQSAAIVVVRENWNPERGDRYVDLRVDEHPEPVIELIRIFRLYDSAFLMRPGSRNIMIGEAEDIKRLKQMLKDYGYYSGDIDGYLSRDFALALMKFMTEKGLSATVYLDSLTVKHLVREYEKTLKRSPK
ncbi:MAG: DUF1028 domain-containing protein [Candidatus Bathyarchaeia archaeon]